MQTEIRYPVARDAQGNILWAHEEARRIWGGSPRLDYFCVACEAQMVLRAGPVRRPHFAHRTKTAACGGESALHRLGRATAADVIRRRGYLVHVCPECRFIAIRPSGHLFPEEEAPMGPWRLDLLLRRREGGSPFLALEIVVTNSPKPEKIQDLIQHGIPVGILYLGDFRDLDRWHKALPLSALHGWPCPSPWHPLPSEIDLRMVILEEDEPWCRCERPRERIFVEANRFPARESALERLGQKLRAFLRSKEPDLSKRRMFRDRIPESGKASWDLRFASLEYVASAAGLSRDEIRWAWSALKGRGRVLIQRCPDCRQERPAEVFRRHARLDARFFEALRALGLTELSSATSDSVSSTIQPPSGRLLLMANFQIVREVPVEIQDLPIQAWDMEAWKLGIWHAPPWKEPCGRCGDPLQKKRWLRREKAQGKERILWLCPKCAEQDEQALGPFWRAGEEVGSQ